MSFFDWRLKVQKRLNEFMTSVRTKTVAVLLGWTGSVHPHLAKYAQVYHERGISTVQYSPPLLRYRNPAEFCLWPTPL